MSEDKTQHLPSFQTQVLTKLEEVSTRLSALEARVSHAEQSKPALDQLGKDLNKHNAEIKSLLGDISRKLDIVNKDIFP